MPLIHERACYNYEEHKDNISIYEVHTHFELHVTDDRLLELGHNPTSTLLDEDCYNLFQK
jgi:hypothetical protein